MTDGPPAPVNNPVRVNPAFARVDPVQAGRLRVINVLGAGVLRVGSPLAEQEAAAMLRDVNDYHTVETTETRLSKDGKTSVRFVAGSQVSKATAAEYGLVDDPEIVFARPAGEVPDIAPTELEARGLGPAPQNKAEAAPPQNRRRSGGTNADSDAGNGGDGE